MSQESEGSGPVEGTGEGGAERHPTDLLGSQSGSQGAGPEPAQPSGEQPPDAKPAEEFPRAVQDAVATDPTAGWAEEDDKKPEPDIMAPVRPSRPATDELNGLTPPSHRRWWVWAIWIAAAIVVATFISLAVQNGEEKDTASLATKPVVAQKVAPAKSNKDKVAAPVAAAVQSSTDIMVVDPNVLDASSGTSASTAMAPSESAPASATVATASATVTSNAVVGMAAGASEQAGRAEVKADEAKTKIIELEAKVAELQRKLDEAVKAGAADAVKLRKEFEAAKAELDNAMATVPPLPAASAPPASTSPPPTSVGSRATGSSAATHLLVDPAEYLRFCLKYGGTQEGCDSTLKDLQQ